MMLFIALVLQYFSLTCVDAADYVGIYDRIAEANLTNYWMEIGYSSVDDSAFVSVSTYATSFTSPAVFVSAPVYGTSLYTGGFPLAPRIKDITVSGGATSFKFKVRDIFFKYNYLAVSYVLL
jgi:hypothetical protein